MAQLGDIRRLLAEDFKKEDQEMIKVLADIENRFKDDVANEMNGNIDLANLKDNIVEIKMTVDACGIPTGNDRFNTDVRRISGLTVVDAINLTDTTETGYPTGNPYIIRRNRGGQLLDIARVTNLVANHKYILRVRVHSKE